MAMRITVELQRSRREDALSSALEWWQSLRPDGWDLHEHLAAPDTNASTRHEKRLAVAIARAVEVGAL